MSKAYVRIVTLNPKRKTKPPSKKRATNSKLIGEEREMRYALTQVTRLGDGGDALTSIFRIKRIVRHALHAGFVMGRGR